MSAASGALDKIKNGVIDGIGKVLSIPDRWQDDPTHHKIACCVFSIFVMCIGFGMAAAVTYGFDPTTLTTAGMSVIMGMLMSSVLVGVGTSWLLQSSLSKENAQAAAKIMRFALPLLIGLTAGFLCAGSHMVAGAGNNFGYLGFIMAPLPFYYLAKLLKNKPEGGTFVPAQPELGSQSQPISSPEQHAQQRHADMRQFRRELSSSEEHSALMSSSEEFELPEVSSDDSESI